MDDEVLQPIDFAQFPNKISLPNLELILLRTSTPDNETTRS